MLEAQKMKRNKGCGQTKRARYYEVMFELYQLGSNYTYVERG